MVGTIPFTWKEWITGGYYVYVSLFTYASGAWAFYNEYLFSVQKKSEEPSGLLKRLLVSHLI